MESYRFGSYDEAIKMLQTLKSRGENKKIVVFTIDFDNENKETEKIVTTIEEGCVLVKKSKTIIINEDTVISHIQLFSCKQSDLKNIIKRGIMHDIIFNTE